MAKKEKETNKKVDNKEVVFITKELKQKDSGSEEFVKVRGFIIFVVIILVLIGLLALINGNYVTKDYKTDDTTTTSTSIEYDSSLISVSSVFDMSDKSYYVLFYDSSDAIEKEFAEEFAGDYTDTTVPLYKVDMSKAMNKAYYDTEGKENTSPTSKDDLMITRTTLMKIKKGKVVSYVTDKLTIAQTLNPEEEDE